MEDIIHFHLLEYNLDICFKHTNLITMKKIFYFSLLISTIIGCGTKQIVVDDCISSSQWASFLNTSDLTYQKYNNTVSGPPVISGVKLNGTNVSLADTETKTINNGTFVAYKTAIEVSSEDIISYNLDIIDIYKFEAYLSSSSSQYYNYNYKLHMVMFPENYYSSNNYSSNSNYDRKFKCVNLNLENFIWDNGSSYTSQPNTITDDNVKMNIKQNQNYFNCLELPNNRNNNVNYNYNYNTYSNGNIRRPTQNIPDGIYYVGFILSKEDISNYIYNSNSSYSNNTYNYNTSYSRLNSSSAEKTIFLKINYKNKPKDNNICVDKNNYSYGYILN